MASRKFTKESQEWLMFTEYWKLVQKYYDVELDNTQGYWNPMLAEFAEFGKKFKDIPLAKKLAYSFIDIQEEKERMLKNA